MKLHIAKLGSLATVLCLAAAAPLNATVIHFTAPLKGASEVPPTDSKGTGAVEADFDNATNQFSYEVRYEGLTGPAVAAHFHGPAAAGANAPPIIAIKALASPIKGSAKLTPDQAKELMAGKWYFNIHTAAHGPGEIRGQLTPP
jgi:hypothetical protein